MESTLLFILRFARIRVALRIGPSGQPHAGQSMSTPGLAGRFTMVHECFADGTLIYPTPMQLGYTKSGSHDDTEKTIRASSSAPNGVSALALPIDDT